MNTTNTTTPLDESVTALASAIRAFDPHTVIRAKTMTGRVRQAVEAFRVARRLQPTTVEQEARIEARLLPLAKQARQKFATLAALGP